MESDRRPLHHTGVRTLPSGVGALQRAGDARRWIVLGLVGLGAFVPVKASARDVLPGGARQENPPGQRIVDAAVSPRDTTYDGLTPVESSVIDGGAFPEVSAGTWYWILHRHALSRPESRDTVRQDELVLQFRATGRKDPVPIWHDRSAEAGPLPRPPRAAPHGDALLMVHRRCMRGTGGCMEWPFRLSDGTVDPLHRPYLDELRARIPDEWGLWKGVYLNPADLTVEAPVYVPADPNCCASFWAEGRVSLRGDAFSGLGWEGGASWSEGRGELRLILAPDREALSALDSDPRADELYGDHDVSSSHPLVANLGITVATITIGWATPTPDQIRFCG